MAHPSSSSVSASFPYIRVPGESDSDDDESADLRASLVHMSPKVAAIDEGRKAAAAAHMAALVREQAVAVRGPAYAADPDAPDAPWRTDDSLLSPSVWADYCKYPGAVDDFLRFSDPSRTTAEERAEFARYMALTRFGEVEQNAWRIFKRTCKQKKGKRVRRTHAHSSRKGKRFHSQSLTLVRVLSSLLLLSLLQAVVWLNGSGAVEKDWTFGELYSRVCVLSLHLRSLKVAKGSRAVLCFVPGLEFFVAFWACLSQGIVAVPVTPPDPFNPKVG